MTIPKQAINSWRIHIKSPRNNASYSRIKQDNLLQVATADIVQLATISLPEAAFTDLLLVHPEYRPNKSLILNVI